MGYSDNLVALGSKLMKFVGGLLALTIGKLTHAKYLFGRAFERELVLCTKVPKIAAQCETMFKTKDFCGNLVCDYFVRHVSKD